MVELLVKYAAASCKIYNLWFDKCVQQLQATPGFMTKFKICLYYNLTEDYNIMHNYVFRQTNTVDAQRS